MSEIHEGKAEVPTPAGARYEVDLAPQLSGIYFAKVSGLHPESSAKDSGPRQQGVPNPEIAAAKNYGKITLEGGIFPNDDAYWNWHHEAQMGSLQKQDVSIRFFNEKNHLKGNWWLLDALPGQILSSSLRGEGAVVRVDLLEVFHEQLVNISGG